MNELPKGDEGAAKSEQEPATRRPVTGRRSARNIKAAARILEKEGRRIVRKHAKRIPPKAVEEMREAIAGIAQARADGSVADLERHAEALDELLHSHASFARKSALRETAENVLIAVLVAFGLRSCLYEPFKIPSGSMMPTLRSGDHIFVNKYAYGVQIPLTDTVVAEDWLSTIHRGDVVVFRYPLDEREDYIKRVMGLPGDQIKVEGDDVYLRRAGEGEFEKLAREPLDEPCLVDGDPSTVVEDCVLFRETVDDRSYVVRYVDAVAQAVEPTPRVLEVPPDHLLVMGDNRRLSHDSLQWMTTVEAVSAGGLLTHKDLRDLTGEQFFTIRHPEDARGNPDPGFDHVLYLADHPSAEASLSLEVWRDPSLGAPALFAALDHALGERATARNPAASIGVEEGLEGAEEVVDLRFAAGAEGDRIALWRTRDEAVLQLRCGRAACEDEASLARRVGAIMSNYAVDHRQDGRELLEGDAAVRYSEDWRGRDLVEERFRESTWRARGDAMDAGDPRGQVRLRSWRDPDEELTILVDAALASFDGRRDGGLPVGRQASRVDAAGAEVWALETADAFVDVLVVRDTPFVAVLECGKDRCRTSADAATLAGLVASRIPAAMRDHRALDAMLTSEEVGGWEARPIPAPEKYEWDRVSLAGSVRGGSYAAGLRVALKPATGLAATAAAWAKEAQGAVPDDTIAPGGSFAESSEGFGFVLPIAHTDVVVGFNCARGLCADEASARAIARRVAEKALDPANYIDPEAQRPKPFVPRGNVKGRAERIWLPTDRFWMRIE